jgi:hypothetical protein
MRKVATAYFCGNGHLLDESEQNEYCKYDMKTSYPLCEICQNDEIYIQYEWGNLNYEQLVPQNPIGFTPFFDNELNETYDVSIYDVSKLKEKGKVLESFEKIVPFG